MLVNCLQIVIERNEQFKMLYYMRTPYYYKIFSAIIPNKRTINYCADQFIQYANRKYRRLPDVIYII